MFIIAYTELVAKRVEDAHPTLPASMNVLIPRYHHHHH